MTALARAIELLESVRARPTVPADLDLGGEVIELRRIASEALHQLYTARDADACAVCGDEADMLDGAGMVPLCGSCWGRQQDAEAARDERERGYRCDRGAASDRECA